MSVVDDLVAAVEAGSGDAGKKAVVVGFLQSAGPIVETLGPSVFQELMRGIAGGGLDGVPDGVIANLDARQVAALLASVDADLSAMVEKHGAEVAAWKAAEAQLQEAALGVLARVIVGVL